MDDLNERAIRRLERLRWVLTGTVIVLAIAIIVLLVTDFAPS